nr:MAG TPA: hypothetical protein [Caudoviricetes sp.]
MMTFKVLNECLYSKQTQTFGKTNRDKMAI